MLGPIRSGNLLAAVAVATAMPLMGLEGVASPAVGHPGTNAEWMARVLHGPAAVQKASGIGARVAGSATASPVGPQVLDDPGFERGHPNPYWTESSNEGYAVIVRAGAHSGAWSAALCGDNSCSDGVEQGYLSPELTLTATLSVWFRMISHDPSAGCGDYFTFGIADDNGNTSPSMASAYCTDWADGNWHHVSIDETTPMRNFNVYPFHVFAGGVTDGDGLSTLSFADDLDLAVTALPDIPHAVLAEADNGAATIKWTIDTPTGSGTTSYTIDAYTNGGATMAGTENYANPTTTEVFHGLTNGTTYTFKVTGHNPYGSSVSDASNPATPDPAYPFVAVSDQQYRFAGSDGTAWKDMDPTYLATTITSPTDALALISGNVDLWTANAGYNQDIGIAVDGAVAAWKESGGFGGTFSPNAAFVQTVVPIVAGTVHTIKLAWKTNRPAGGATIFAGAGPIGLDFSPTRLTVQLVPGTGLVSPNLATDVSLQQFRLTGSDGVTWVDLGPTSAPALSWSAPDDGTAIITGNADLWTTVAGYNQDIGITVSGPGFPSVSGQPESWKESGGNTGTFSPNAALVRASIPVTKGAAYGVKLQWKTNQPSPASVSIFAGAGVTGRFSPTRLTLLFVPNGSGYTEKISTQQYRTAGTDIGFRWVDMDPTGLSLTISPPRSCLALLSANVDLWTDTAGYNQDIAMVVVDDHTIYHSPDKFGWKESGGRSGSFSPKAAFLQTLYPMVAGVTYTVLLDWKPNRSLPNGSNIWAGAGPIGARFSQTRLDALLVCP